MACDSNVYGYVNGSAVYSRDEFVFAARHFGPIESDDELLAFAEKVSGHWFNAGWRRTFTTYYLSDYALAEPYRSLTKSEFERLKELQRMAVAEEKRREEEKEWRKVKTIYWMDNSVEDIYENKYGEQKTVMVVAPHGDIC